MGDPYIDRAKQLLRKHLEKHDDPGVRLMAVIFEIADDHPSVLAIAAKLRGTALTKTPEQKS